MDRKITAILISLIVATSGVVSVFYYQDQKISQLERGQKEIMNQLQQMTGEISQLGEDQKTLLSLFQQSQEERRTEIANLYKELKGLNATFQEEISRLNLGQANILDQLKIQQEEISRLNLGQINILDQLKIQKEGIEQLRAQLKAQSQEIDGLKETLQLDGKYDTAGHLVTVEQMGLAINSTVVIAFFVEKQGKLTKDAIWYGIGTVISVKGSTYIVTFAASAFNWYRLQGAGEFYAKAFIWDAELNRAKMIFPAKASWENNVIFYEAPSWLRNLAVPIGNSDELKSGTYVYIASGLSRGASISSFFPPPYIDTWIATGNFSGISENDFALLSVSVFWDEVGIPIFASRDGKLELVGLVFGILQYELGDIGRPGSPDGFGWIIKTNTWQEVIDTLPTLM